MTATREIAVDPRLASLTPDRLSQVVATGGGMVLRDWEHIYSPEEGGDGVWGHYVLYLAGRDGTEIGNVGFVRAVDGRGGVQFTLNDFWDERFPSRDGRTSWTVEENARGFLRLLAEFVPSLA